METTVMTPEERIEETKLAHALSEIQSLETRLREKEEKRAEWEKKYLNLTAGDAESLTTHNLALKMDWIALSNELEILNGAPDVGANSSKVLTFINTLRQTALSNLEQRSIEELVVMTSAYEVWYRACVATLQNRSLKLKIEKNAEFEKTKKELKRTESELRTAKEAVKEASRRRTPEEIMIEQLTKLLGSETAARAQYAKMQEIAKGVNGK